MEWVNHESRLVGKLPKYGYFGISRFKHNFWDWTDDIHVSSLVEEIFLVLNRSPGIQGSRFCPYSYSTMIISESLMLGIFSVSTSSTISQAIVCF